jgi:hypothetical protein
MNHSPDTFSAIGQPVTSATGQRHSPDIRLIDSKQLAAKLNLPESWVRDQVRRRPTDPLPHYKMGKYVRFRWDSPELQDWLARRLIALVGEQKRTKKTLVIQ